MLLTRIKLRLALFSLLPIILSNCYSPPYNNFLPDHKRYSTNPDFHQGIGPKRLPGRGLYKGGKKALIDSLIDFDIQYVYHGATHTLIIPTDRYYLFDSPRLNPVCYPGLARIIKLMEYYPDSTFYVAGFTDNIGSKQHKNTLSQAQAETMLTYLWANGINSRQLNAEGYGDKFAVSDNSIIHGSAQNRRIEVQWFNPIEQRINPAIPYFGPTK